MDAIIQFFSQFKDNFAQVIDQILLFLQNLIPGGGFNPTRLNPIQLNLIQLILKILGLA